MTTEKRFINFRLDGCHMTSRARRCDVTEFLKLSLSKSNNIVLTNFGVRYNSRFVIDVDKKFTKILTDPRISENKPQVIVIISRGLLFTRT